MEEFKETLGSAYASFMTIINWIRDCYVMDEMIKGNEVKFRRSGKTLVTFYVRELSFDTLIIFGKKERELYEEKRNIFSTYINDYYHQSKTYHDGKWMFIKIANETYIEDIKGLIEIKKKPNKKQVNL